MAGGKITAEIFAGVQFMADEFVGICPVVVVVVIGWFISVRMSVDVVATLGWREISSKVDGTSLVMLLT